MKKSIVIIAILALVLAGCTKTIDKQVGSPAITNTPSPTLPDTNPQISPSPDDNSPSQTPEGGNEGSDKNCVGFINIQVDLSNGYYNHDVTPDDPDNFTESQIKKNDLDKNMENIVIGLYTKTVQAIDWFENDPQDLGFGDKYLLDNNSQLEYYIVTNPSYPNAEVFKDYLRSFMSEEYMKKLFNDGFIIEYEGKLYAHEGDNCNEMGAAAEYNIFSVADKSEDTMKLDIYEPSPFEDENVYYKFYMDIQKVNGKWIVTDAYLE
jgi:hypothetical protein